MRDNEELRQMLRGIEARLYRAEAALRAYTTHDAEQRALIAELAPALGKLVGHDWPPAESHGVPCLLCRAGAMIGK